MNAIPALETPATMLPTPEPSAPTPASGLEVRSELLGSLVVPVGQTFRFEFGILGLPEARTFALVPADRDGFFWLQSVESSALTFLLADPFHFVDDYGVDIEPADLGVSPSEPGSPEDVLVLAIVTLPRETGAPATLNLQGPLAFHLGRRTGRQIVVDGGPGLRYPVDLAGGAAH